MKLKKIKWANLIIHLFFIVMCLAFIIPLAVVISVSLSNEVDIAKYGFSLIPKKIDYTAYAFIFKNPDVMIKSYITTFIMSFVALILYLVLASMIAYPLSKKNFKHKKWISFYLVFTMLFNAGTVPSYLLNTQYLHIQDTYWALILPLLGNVMYIFVMRTFFQQLPEAVSEAAFVDGAGEFRVFCSIIIPLSTPVLATVGVLTLMANWNSWYHALLYINDPDLYPLQYLLQIILRNLQEVTGNMDKMPTGISVSQNIPPEPVRMAMAVVATGPMLFIFPFFQKYFAQGLTVGAVKG